MNDPVRSSGEVAGKLARNPLGIIALFIVLIYGLATATTIYTGNLSPSERLPFTWFLVLFPVLVLLFFVHLVIHHSDKLYGPGDFRDEANYMKLKTAVLLGAATAKNQNPTTDEDVAGIVDSVRVAGRRTTGTQRQMEEPNPLGGRPTREQHLRAAGIRSDRPAIHISPVDR